jgi:release factor glutamine methyltransferase
VNRRQALALARDLLEGGDIGEAPLEGEILLRHVLGMDRSQLFSGLDVNLNPAQAKALDVMLERRIRGEPSAYITGHREFYGLNFSVDSSVLIPRPETELLVEQALALAREVPLTSIADIGTGCGAIAVSLAVNLPGVTIYATDLSPAALKVARANCRRHGVAERVILLQGDLLEPLKKPVGMIIANLPYVREADLSPGGPLSHEPALALDGGRDGLQKITALCRQAVTKLGPGGSLLLEIGEGQADGVTAVLRGNFPLGRIDIRRDLAGIDRVLTLRLT